MSDQDRLSAEYYEDERHHQPTGPARQRQRRASLTRHVPVRFDAATIERATGLADRDGLSVSSWIRRVVVREVEYRLSAANATGTSISMPNAEWTGERPSLPGFALTSKSINQSQASAA